jgi:hypothetical protein
MMAALYAVRLRIRQTTLDHHAIVRAANFLAKAVIAVSRVHR